MGGTAHHNELVKPLTTKERLATIEKLQWLLNQSQIFDSIISPEPAPEKHTHGDVDILVTLKKGCSNHEMERSFADAGLYQKLQHSYLFDIQSEDDGQTKIVQIDIQQVPKEKLLLYYFVLSYGDLGMIVGTCVKPLRLKLSCSKGLQFIPDSDRQEMKYTVSTCPKEICETFLNLDYAKWQQGFKSEEQVFEWIAAMRPCSVGMLEDKKAGRIEKRFMYQRFCEWNTKRMQRLSEQEKQLEMEWRKSRAITVLKQCGMYETLKAKIDKDLREASYRNQLKARFNGNIVREYIEIYRPEVLYRYERQNLSDLMKHVRSLIQASADQAKNSYYLPDADEIKSFILHSIDSTK